MANNEFMALFGSDSVTANVFSETDAVKYRLIVRGSNSDSAIRDIEVSINGNDIASRTTNAKRGVNMIVLNPDLTVYAYKQFDTYTNTTANAQAVIDYLSSLSSDKVACIYTYDAMYSSPELDTYMFSIGSRAWAGTKFLARKNGTYWGPRSSYCAIYHCGMKKIAMENFVGNSAIEMKEDTRSFVEVIFDDFSDIGATGIPERMIDDVTEYASSGNDYSFKIWQDFPNVVGTDISRGDIFYFSADLFHDQTLQNAGGYCALYVLTQDASNNWLTSTILRTQGLSADQYHRVEGYYTIPTTGTAPAKMLANVYRFPSSVKTGVAKCKNVVLAKVPREARSNGTAAIGVNGIRMTDMTEFDDTGTNPIATLLSLPTEISGQDSPKKILSGNFAEMDTIISDPNTYGSTSTTYVTKTYIANQTTISSLNIKVGDTIRVSGEVMRDATALANGKYAWVLVRFFDVGGNTILYGGLTDINTIPSVFNFMSNELVVPVNTVSMDLAFYRAPSNTAAGTVQVRNIKLSNNRGA